MTGFLYRPHIYTSTRLFVFLFSRYFQTFLSLDTQLILDCRYVSMQEN